MDTTFQPGAEHNEQDCHHEIAAVVTIVVRKCGEADLTAIGVTVDPHWALRSALVKIRNSIDKLSIEALNSCRAHSHAPSLTSTASSSGNAQRSPQPKK